MSIDTATTTPPQVTDLLSAQPAPSGEPVGTVFTMEALGTPGRPFCHVQLSRTLPTGTKLYTAPQAPSVPDGWSIAKKGDGRIVVKSPSGDAWAWEDEHSTGTSNDFVYSLLSAMLAAAHHPNRSQS